METLLSEHLEILRSNRCRYLPPIGQKGSDIEGLYDDVTKYMYEVYKTSSYCRGCAPGTIRYYLIVDWHNKYKINESLYNEIYNIMRNAWQQSNKKHRSYLFK